MAPPQGACGRGCAPVPNSMWGRGLSERSEFRSPNLSGPGQRPPKGHAWAPMVLGPFAETKGPRRAGAKPRIPFLSVILDISNRGSSVFVVGSCLWSLHSHPRQRMAPPQGACGRGCAAVPNFIWGRGLSERSEFRSPSNRDWGKGTQRATPGRPWFWVLLPKQKDLGARGRNPASSPPPFCHPCMCSVIC